jgi:hypothetical protein
VNLVYLSTITVFKHSPHPFRLRRNPRFEDIKRDKFGSTNTSDIDAVILMKCYFILLKCKQKKLASSIFDQMTGLRNSYSRAIKGTIFKVVNTCTENTSFWLIRDLILLNIQVRFPELPDFLRSSESGTGSSQPREENWGAIWMKK